MELKKTWFEKLEPMKVEACIPLEDASVQSVYSAIRRNKAKLKGRKYRVQPAENCVCRVK